VRWISQASKDPAELQRRPKLLRKLIGENPRWLATSRHRPKGRAKGRSRRTLAIPANRVRRSAARWASRLVEDGDGIRHRVYVTDLRRVVEFDAHDKATKASKNAVFRRSGEGRP
jgi:hypothetical protein